MLLVHCAAVLGLVVMLGPGCSVGHACCGVCPEDAFAVFELSCGSTDLADVAVTGPCEAGDATVSTGFSYVGDGRVFVSAQAPGVCHVVLTFATGFTYAADVTFASTSGGTCGGQACPPCPNYIAPTASPFQVNNPADTCVDAGLDAPDEEGPEASACPATALQSAPCVFSGSCTGCRYNVRFDCTCAEADASVTSNAEAGGPEWQCIDTGMQCVAGNR